MAASQFVGGGALLRMTAVSHTNHRWQTLDVRVLRSMRMYRLDTRTSFYR